MPIPEGWSAGMIIGSGGCNVKQLRSIAQCCVKVESEKKRVKTKLLAVIISTNTSRSWLLLRGRKTCNQ